MIIVPPGAATRASSLTNFLLSGMCSPLSMDQTRSNCPSGNGCSKASATWRETLSDNPCAAARAFPLSA
uniref:Uncharacterized protein n=1 Tax=Arundo donax TaxID=35708 RepID=A0A0A9CVW4_ARUDO